MMTITRIRKRRQEGGFTLIELLVVILIVAILMAVAVAAFSRNKGRALDSGAQQQLAQLESSARSFLADHVDYGVSTTATSYYDPAGATNAATKEGDFTFVAHDADSTVSGSSSTVSWLNSQSTMAFADMGKTTCFYTVIDVNGVKLRHAKALAAAGDCTADAALAATTGTWDVPV